MCVTKLLTNNFVFFFFNLYLFPFLKNTFEFLNKFLKKILKLFLFIFKFWPSIQKTKIQIFIQILQIFDIFDIKKKKIGFMPPTF